MTHILILSDTINRSNLRLTFKGPIRFAQIIELFANKLLLVHRDDGPRLQG